MCDEQVCFVVFVSSVVRYNYKLYFAKLYCFSKFASKEGRREREKQYF